MTNAIYIVAAKRTPMGSFNGKLSSLSAPQLGALCLREMIQANNLNGDYIDEVYMGNVLSAGLGQAPARQASLLAEIPNSVPTTTLNKVCGSGMKAVMLGASDILHNGANLVACGGMESMSRAPYMLPKGRFGMRMGHGEILDHMFIDGLQDAYSGALMGAYAQQMADTRNLSRGAMDDFTLESLTRARHAQERGDFHAELFPVEITAKKTIELIIEDEPPKLARPEKIRQLKPAFSKQGTVTAANASSIADGASGLLLASSKAIDMHNLDVLAEIKGYASYACKPEDFTIAPVGAVLKLISSLNWHIEDVDLFEMNEAFALVPMLAMSDLNIPHTKVNIRGGACALGHPLGSSGSRIIVTLIHALRDKGLKRGIATLCIGGGEATAIAIEI
jgi:acetyl-CoA C-acetyltransferase